MSLGQSSLELGEIEQDARFVGREVVGDLVPLCHGPDDEFFVPRYVSGDQEKGRPRVVPPKQVQDSGGRYGIWSIVDCKCDDRLLGLHIVDDPGGPPGEYLDDPIRLEHR